MLMQDILELMPMIMREHYRLTLQLQIMLIKIFLLQKLIMLIAQNPMTIIHQVDY